MINEDNQKVNKDRNHGNNTKNSEKSTEDLSILGSEVREPVNKVECFQAPEDIDWISFETDELLSNCPVTGQPDKYDLELIYLPQNKCIESKSLKLYLWKFRDEKHFAENLASIIAKDIFEVCEPKKVIIRLYQNRRGGLELSTQASKAVDGYETVFPDVRSL